MLRIIDQDLFAAWAYGEPANGTTTASLVVDEAHRIKTRLRNVETKDGVCRFAFALEHAQDLATFSVACLQDETVVCAYAHLVKPGAREFDISEDFRDEVFFAVGESRNSGERGETEGR